ncbi:MAG: cytochrome P460 family protein [Bdellovibrionales bacterium]
MVMTRLFFYILAAGLTFVTVAPAYFESADQAFRGKAEMNGIKFEKYRDFPTRWKLVTVRFRHDSGEMRLTYANELAFQHLEKGTTGQFPDGAILGKVSFKTDRDPAFTSSEIPTNSRRYQLMVKDTKRYKEQDGWGYALFDSDGLTFDEDPKIKIQSCHACHQIVKDSNFVFSELAPFAVGKVWRPRSALKSMISWETVETVNLPKRVKKTLDAEKIQKVYSLRGPMNVHFFSGTLDELVPSLIDKSHAEKSATIFIGDSENFTLVIPKEQKCSLIKVIFRDRLVRDEMKCASP